jgi:Zn ribbon nucleic-acid-binding protein
MRARARDRNRRRAETLAAAEVTPGGVIKLPTWITVTCPSCRHQAHMAIRLENVGKMRCSRCGCRDPIVAGREPLRSWSRYRRRAR